MTPLRQLRLAGGVGWRDEKMLYVRAFLALRQLRVLAERGRGVGLQRDATSCNDMQRVATT
jgi:hypothetical protein